jgi:hypothetical protein
MRRVSVTDDGAVDSGEGGDMNETSLQERAEHHASEAERLLAGKLGMINNIIKADVHATLAVYYATQSQRSSDHPAGAR